MLKHVVGPSKKYLVKQEDHTQSSLNSVNARNAQQIQVFENSLKGLIKQLTEEKKELSNKNAELVAANGSLLNRVQVLEKGINELTRKCKHQTHVIEALKSFYAEEDVHSIVSKKLQAIGRQLQKETNNL